MLSDLAAAAEMTAPDGSAGAGAKGCEATVVKEAALVRGRRRHGLGPAQR